MCEVIIANPKVYILHKNKYLRVVIVLTRFNWLRLWINKPFSLNCGPENHACTEILWVAKNKTWWRAVVSLDALIEPPKAVSFRFLSSLPTKQREGRGWMLLTGRAESPTASAGYVVSIVRRADTRMTAMTSTIGQRYFPIKIPRNKQLKDLQGLLGEILRRWATFYFWWLICVIFIGWIVYLLCILIRYFSDAYPISRDRLSA